MALVIGIDAGGTFTDLVARDMKNNRIFSHKLPSTPANPADAIVRGIDELIGNSNLRDSDVDLVAHGTTVGTNALLQRKGARVALITTKGFRDLLEIGRQTRPINYDMHLDQPAPVVPRHRRIEITERIGADHRIVTPLTEKELDDAINRAIVEEPQAIAVCLLFSYLNPVHELAVKEKIQGAFPDIFVSASCEVQPEFREYERFTTTALNAYLQPIMARYLDDLDQNLKKSRPKARVAVSRSNGGLMSLPLAKRFPIRTALSGPAAGVVGAIDTQRSANRPNVITFDMGGTSADVALVQQYSCGLKHQSSIGGFPIRTAKLNIHTVGAGGGSIAWFDRDDLLKVGPKSAGADPGPVCYGKGGHQPTVTDANLVLGRLPLHGLLGGTMELYPDLARKALSLIANRLDVSIEDGAQGIIDIVTSNMVRAIRSITIEQGFDPREFSLLAFGGAGPLHAREVACQLGIKEIVVPVLPGILCAQGALASSFREEIVQTTRQPINKAEDLETISKAIQNLIDSAHHWCISESLDADALKYNITLEMRYVGQNFEISVPLLPEEVRSLPPPSVLRSRFFDYHDRQYGFHSKDGPVEVVNIRLSAEVDGLPTGSMIERDQKKQLGSAAGERQVWFNRQQATVPVYQREALKPGQTIIGPAVIDQADTTTIVFPNDQIRIDENLNIIIGIGR